MRRRVVDATYLSPTIPATTPAPFGVADDVDVVAVNELARLSAAPQQLRDRRFRQDRNRRDRVVVGERRAARPNHVGAARVTRGCSTARSSSPIRPSRFGLAADTMAAAADAESLDDLFLRLEAAGVMLRIDTSVMPTMAKTPTLGAWELDRAPHHRARRSPRPHQARDAPRDRARPTGRFRSRRARSWCTAPRPDCSTRRWFRSGDRTRSGCRRSASASRASARRWPATWRRPATTTASATGCVRPTPFPTAPPTGRGCRSGELSRRARTARSPTSRPGPTRCALNPARIEPSQRDDPAVQAAATRLADTAERGLTRMAELAPEPPT